MRFIFFVVLEILLPTPEQQYEEQMKHQHRIANEQNIIGHPKKKVSKHDC